MRYHNLLQCDQCFTRKTKPKCINTPHERHCKKCQTDKSGCSWRGKSCEVVEGDGNVALKRSKGELVLEADESSSRDKVQEIVVPRGEYHQPYFTFSADHNTAECVGRRPARLAVPTAGTLTSRGREPARQATRATQKGQGAEPTRSKSKGKGKALVVDEVREELRKEELERLIAKRAVIQERINYLLK
jgi:hypothetical protein